jgi:uncharacterized membrane protein YccC
MFPPRGRLIATVFRTATRILSGRRAELRQTARVTIGCLVAFAVYHLFNLPQGYWAVFTVVIVMQGSIGGTLTASIDRMKGTLLGAVIGGLAAWLRPHTPLGLGVSLGVSVAITALAATLRPTLKVAPVTAVIMLVSPTAGVNPLEAALQRVIEIALGSVIGVVTTLFVFPARSSALVAIQARAALVQAAEIADHYADDAASDEARPDRYAEHVRLRAALGAVDAAMIDAAQERSSRLSDHRIAEALPRTLWRVRNDIVSVGRALSPLPADVQALIAPGVSAMLKAQAGFMRECGEAVCADRVVDRTGRIETLQTFELAVDALRRARLTQDLGFDAVGHVFALAFSLESLHRNLGDLADRIDDTARGRAEGRIEPV